MPSKRKAKERSTTYGPRILKSAWKAHLPEVKRLYLKEDRSLTGENGVIEEMKRQHGFHANEGQYYAMFKNEGISKNVKQHEWSLVFAHLDRQQRRGQKGTIRIHGRSYTKEQIATARRHHGRYIANSNLEQDTRDSVPNLPLGFEVLPGTSDVVTKDLFDFHGESSLESSVPASSWEDVPLHGHQYGPFSQSCNLRDTPKQGNPYQWHNSLDWNSLGALIASQQEYVSQGNAIFVTCFSNPGNLAMLTTAYRNMIKSMFWPSNQHNRSLARTTREMAAKFLLSTLFNNMTGLQQIHLDHTHQWIKKLPPNTVLQFFGKFREEEMSILRERVFAAALQSGDTNIIGLMLSLGSNVHESISVHQRGRNVNITPLEAVLTGKCFQAVKFVMERCCHNRGNAYVGKSLRLLKTVDDINVAYPGLFRRSELKLLYLIALDALNPEEEIPQEAHLDHHWCNIVGDDKSLVVRILNLQQVPASTWLKRGYFERIVQLYSPRHPRKIKSLIKTVLNYCAQENQASNFTDDPEVQAAFQKIISRTGWEGYLVNNIGRRLGLITCDRSFIPKSPSTTSIKGIVSQAISKGDAQSVLALIDPASGQKFSTWQLFRFLRKAFNSGQEALVHEIVCLHPVMLSRGLALYMANGKLSGLCTLLRTDILWDAVLSNSADQGWNALADIIFDHVSTEDNRRKVCFILQAIAYHSIHTNDPTLLKFVLRCGADLGDGIYDAYGGTFEKTPKEQSQIGADEMLFPSLLAIAASKNRLSIIQLLYDEGADVRESAALEHAVHCGATDTTLKMLLDFATGIRPPYRTRGYGSPALCRAIRQRRYETLKFLAPRTDVSGIGLLVEGTRQPEFMESNPLVEAIASSDTMALQILLANGADANGLVSRIGLHGGSKRGSHLNRVTPVLASIAFGNISMLKLLLQSGALIEHICGIGVLRSPLQRAAEIGDFEAVEYLLERGAIVDFNGIWNGATALQFAAIGGYVGIARLLLEHGADPNAMPAKGDGRTAFEGAAEWGRPDMVSLLILHGVNPDLRVGEECEPQAVRAIRFAEKSGHKALMRYIEGLWKKYQEDQDVLHNCVVEQLSTSAADKEGDFGSFGEWPTVFTPR